MAPLDPQQDILKRLSQGLLRSTGRTGMNGNILELHHPSAPQIDRAFLHVESETWNVALSLHSGESAGSPLSCRSSELPFQDRSFRMIVLHHLVHEGSEPELAEAVRLLAHDGVLLILGLNRLGWRYLGQGRKGPLPGMAPLRIRDRLVDLGMKMQGFAGAGLAGRDTPEFMARGLSSLGVPLSDVLLLQAVHQDSPDVRPLRFRKPRAGVVQSAPLQG